MEISCFILWNWISAFEVLQVLPRDRCEIKNLATNKKRSIAKDTVRIWPGKRVKHASGIVSNRVAIFRKFLSHLRKQVLMSNLSVIIVWVSEQWVFEVGWKWNALLRLENFELLEVERFAVKWKGCTFGSVTLHSRIEGIILLEVKHFTVELKVFYCCK